MSTLKFKIRFKSKVKDPGLKPRFIALLFASLKAHASTRPFQPFASLGQCEAATIHLAQAPAGDGAFVAFAGRKEKAPPSETEDGAP
jgi:hypothetical protein